MTEIGGNAAPVRTVAQPFVHRGLDEICDAPKQRVDRVRVVVQRVEDRTAPQKLQVVHRPLQIGLLQTHESAEFRIFAADFHKPVVDAHDFREVPARKVGRGAVEQRVHGFLAEGAHVRQRVRLAGHDEQLRAEGGRDVAHAVVRTNAQDVAGALGETLVHALKLAIDGEIVVVQRVVDVHVRPFQCAWPGRARLRQKGLHAVFVARPAEPFVPQARFLRRVKATFDILKIWIQIQLHGGKSPFRDKRNIRAGRAFSFYKLRKDGKKIEIVGVLW